MPPVGYIAYVDEAGDDGLGRIRPLDHRGVSEWLVLSCVLIRADREPEVLPWLRDIISQLKQHQIRYLHFRELRDDKKLLACEYISQLPVRLFAVASHKRNMKGYFNDRASQAKINVTAWFYCWLMRILVERVSDYCHRRSIKHHGEMKTVRFEVASRGGVKLPDVVTYLNYLKDQEEIGLLYNDYWAPSWPVMDFEKLYSYPAKERAGLQLADCVASAFFAGLELNNEGYVKPDFAKALRDRMCLSKRGRVYDYGLKVWPQHARIMVQPNQREILDYYSKK
jgi:hypothetical protein